MNSTKPSDLQHYVSAIRSSELSIYSPIAVGDPDLWIPTSKLEALLDQGLRGICLANLPPRTRSKVVKVRICTALGYPVPKSFRRSQPRFPGQMFDIYTQKSNNLQVWNEQLSPNRRYVIVRVSDAGIIARVKVVTGEILASLDRTGTLTGKYQARCIPGSAAIELISSRDTDVLLPFVSKTAALDRIETPIKNPQRGELLSIVTIFDCLSSLVGKTFQNTGADQDRNRGTALHRLVCTALGYRNYQDDGQFPDIRHQLIEIKLQTSPTIDLGLVRPDSEESLDFPIIEGTQIRHCDVRYAIFYARINGNLVTLTHFFLTTGWSLFTRFPQFQGNVLNTKLQIPLPRNFFDT